MLFFRRYPVIPTLCLLPVVVCGLFGPLFYPHDPTLMNLEGALKPPVFLSGGNFSYLLGTDHMGRDLFSRLIEGARISLIIAVFGVFFSGFVGCLLGVLAGYFGKKLDEVIMRIVDAQMAIPAILLSILLATVLGAGVTTIIIAISVVFWTGYARVIRGETLSLKQRDFITLARVTGCSRARIIMKHVLPNLVSTITVLATLQIGSAILIEASLTFLGVGLQPPATAWGLMISEGRAYLATAWWIPTFAGLAILVTVLGANLLGDWLRDKFDPKLRQL
ncbi:MAG: peptide ABC transporter permease [Chloroflexi bacterium RBG_13_46_14]|nr:MAG: peptide ABC transporter permease [Chloroflexi bacterium RBG_13_46_14]